MAAGDVVLPLEAEAAAHLGLLRADALVGRQRGEEVDEAERVIQVADGVGEPRVPLLDQVVEREDRLVRLALAGHVQLAAVQSLAHLLHERLFGPEQTAMSTTRSEVVRAARGCRRTAMTGALTLSSRNLLSSGS